MSIPEGEQAAPLIGDCQAEFHVRNSLATGVRGRGDQVFTGNIPRKLRMEADRPVAIAIKREILSSRRGSYAQEQRCSDTL